MLIVMVEFAEVPKQTEPYIYASEVIPHLLREKCAIFPDIHKIYNTFPNFDHPSSTV